MIKQFLALTLFLCIYGQSWASSCYFNGSTLNDITENADFKVSESEVIYHYPVELFKAFNTQIGTFPIARCEKSGLAKVTFIDKKTSEVFTAYFTNEDECDGGNSYGVLVSGVLPTPQNAVAYIQDSYIQCL